ncbi:hypothetical protein [Nonomuraea dietziae]|uniref:hypothetical protein n=1 Tax=Nonomuraea dietziae TaxID=65515 RepID=UPI0033CD0C44
MPAEETGPLKPMHPRDWRTVDDFLDQVQLRPSSWVAGGSLHRLEAMLIGYRLALYVHEIDEPFDFWHDGPFSEWLWERLGRTSPLGWAAEIEREAGGDMEPLDLFFRFLDEYRAWRRTSV